MRLLTVATEVTSPLTLPCQSHALHMQGTSCWFSIVTVSNGMPVAVLSVRVTVSVRIGIVTSCNLNGSDRRYGTICAR